jgi:hypothetical protein
MVQQQDWRTSVDQLRDCAVLMFVGVFTCYERRHDKEEVSVDVLNVG